MRAEKRYKIDITIDSGSRKELLYAIKHLSEHLHSIPEKYDRFKINDAIIEYDLEIYGNEMNYREEEINGIWCKIYKSKM